MKSYIDHIREDLNIAKAEVSGRAAKQAKDMGLEYVGFGRYADPKTGQVSFIVKNDQLVPFSKAMKTNNYAQTRSDDFGSMAQAQGKDNEDVLAELSKVYDAMKYDEAELDAIKWWTDTGYYEAGDMLSGMPSDVDSKQLQPGGPQDSSPAMIQALDSAMKKVLTPSEIIVFSAIDAADELAPGVSFITKGFRSTTLSMEHALASGLPSILQIYVPPKKPGVYADDMSVNPGEHEFILPRGAKLKVTGGPNRLVGSSAETPDQHKEINYYTCSLV